MLLCCCHPVAHMGSNITFVFWMISVHICHCTLLQFCACNTLQYYQCWCYKTIVQNFSLSILYKILTWLVLLFYVSQLHKQTSKNPVPICNTKRCADAVGPRNVSQIQKSLISQNVNSSHDCDHADLGTLYHSQSNTSCPNTAQNLKTVASAIPDIFRRA